MEAAYLGVARFRKPHGLKGEALVFPLTDEPEAVFVPGRELVPVDDEGTPTGAPLIVRTARPYHRHWLMTFEGIDSRTPLEAWTSHVLGVRQDELSPPCEGEMYVHEVPGSTVVEDSRTIGVVRTVVGVPGGEILVVDGSDGREHLIPFREPIVQRLDREARRIEVILPPGLLEV